MILTPELIARIRAIVAKHHNAFAVAAFGPKSVPAEVVEQLRAQGLIPKSAGGTLNDAYLYGRVMAILENPAVQGWTSKQVEDWVKRNPIPLTAAETNAVQSAAVAGATHVQGLGNVVSQQTGQLLIEADASLRNQLKATIKEKTAVNLVARETVRKLKSDLGWATKDWARNLDRIAITEKHNAMQQGVAEGIRARDGDDALVAIRPMPDACAACKKLYLGPDDHPRIWKLSQLAPPGANVKKPQSAWVACLGSTHPHCQCQVVRVPAGWGFDKDGNLAPGAQGGKPVPEEAEKSFREERQHLDALREALAPSRMPADELARPKTDLDIEKARKLHGRIEFQGLRISIENAKGSTREWYDAHAGKAGKTVMRWPYGYIRGTEASDGDQVDVYVGPDPHSETVFVVHQRKKLKEGGFGGYDEDKVMLGFRNPDEAKAAYVAHYDDPGFFGSMSMMSMEAFKRLLEERRGKPVSGTIPESHRTESALRFHGSLVKSRDRLLVKADGQVVLQHGNPAGLPFTLPGGETASPSGALGVNAQLGMMRNPPVIDPANFREHLEGIGQERRFLYRDPRVYEFDQDNPNTKRDITLALNGPWGIKTPEDDPERHREDVERRATRIALVDPNTVPKWAAGGGWVASMPPEVDPGAFEKDVVNKGLEAILEYLEHRASLDKAALTHKYVKKEWLHGHWVYTYAEKHGGVLETHPTSKEHLAIKVPADKAEVLHKLKQAHDIKTPVLEGKQWAVLPVNQVNVYDVAEGLMQGIKSELKPVAEKKMTAAPTGTTIVAVDGDTYKKAASGKWDWYKLETVNGAPTTTYGGELSQKVVLNGLGPDELQEAASWPDPEPKVPEPDAHAPAAVIAGHADLKAVDPKSVPTNPKGKWMVQTGAQYAYADTGKVGTFLGWDWKGYPVLDIDGKRHVASFSKMKPVGGTVQAQNPVQNLAHGTVHQPTEFQKQVVKEALGQVQENGHKASEWSEALTKRGHEVFLVGGIVRDMIAMTAPGQGHTLEDVKAAMTDVDFVSTASPRHLKEVHDGIGGVGSGKWEGYEDLVQKGAVIANGGVDLAAMSSGGTYTQPKHQTNGDHARDSTFDHDLLTDTHRRDFTANALYYDVNNDVVVDPTGTGIDDARKKILRRPPGDEWDKNDLLAMRFWKFRTRGWSGEPETTKQIVALAAKEFEKMGSKLPARMKKQFGKHGGSGKKILADLQAAMTEDGAGHLYDKYIKPHAAQLATYLGH